MKKKLGLTTTLVLYVFLVMLLSLALSAAVAALLGVTGLVDFWGYDQPERLGASALRRLAMLAAFSCLAGIAIASFFSKKAVEPIRKLIKATAEIACGNFGVRVEPQGVRELEHLSHSFNAMAKELTSLEALRGDFINNFSHEFKTPIVSIRGFAKLLKEEGLSDAEKREYLDIIIAESERLANLSSNILSLSKYETMEIVSEKTRYRLDEQIRRVVAVTEPQWSAANIDVNIDLDEVTFNGDESLLQQLWINLLGNAIKFSKQGGRIEIRLSETEQHMHFSISDNGIGMDEKTRKRIFDKFFQGDSSRSQKGNGLGLAIAKRIVDLCGGAIEVDSEPGKGSAFSVALPKSPSDCKSAGTARLNLPESRTR